MLLPILLYSCLPEATSLWAHGTIHDLDGLSLFLADVHTSYSLFYSNIYKIYKYITYITLLPPHPILRRQPLLSTGGGASINAGEGASDVSVLESATPVQKESEGHKNALGTINGCYVPCLLNIMGIVLFMYVISSVVALTSFARRPRPPLAAFPSRRAHPTPHPWFHFLACCLPTITHG